MSALRERILDIRARVAEQFEVNHLGFVAIVCDRCKVWGVIIDEDDIEKVERNFEYWFIDPKPPYHDLCPDCVEKLR